MDASFEEGEKRDRHEGKENGEENTGYIKIKVKVNERLQ